MVFPELDFSKPVNGLKKLPVLGAVSLLEMTGILDRFGDDVVAKLPDLVDIRITDEFKSRFLDLTSRGFLPLGYFGHFTHFDHIVLSNGCNELSQIAGTADYTDNLRGFAVTLATSVTGGQQSPFMKAMYSKMESYTRARGVDLVPVTIEKDKERFGLMPKISEKRPLISKLRQGGIGIMIPAGGSVQPGRHPKGASIDQIYGLQEITDTDLVDVFEIMERTGRHIDQQPYYLPVAAIGTWRYFSVDVYMPTLEAIAAFYHKENLGGVTDFLGIKHDYRIEIAYGMPQTAEDMEQNLGSQWRKYPQVVNIFLMTKVAEMLPEYAQGFYGQYLQK